MDVAALRGLNGYADSSDVVIHPLRHLDVPSYCWSLPRWARQSFDVQLPIPPAALVDTTLDSVIRS